MLESLLEVLPNSSKELKKLSPEGGRFFLLVDEFVRARENRLGIWSDGEERANNNVVNDETTRFSGSPRKLPSANPKGKSGVP